MGAHEPESPIEHEGETVTDAGYVTTNKTTNCCPKELVSAPFYCRVEISAHLTVSHVAGVL